MELILEYVKTQGVATGDQKKHKDVRRNYWLFVPNTLERKTVTLLKSNTMYLIILTVLSLSNYYENIVNIQFVPQLVNIGRETNTCIHLSLIINNKVIQVLVFVIFQRNYVNRTMLTR